METPTREGDSPVGERGFDFLDRISQVPRDTWNPAGICPDHGVRLNTHWRPIVNQYREGKVKRTPVRGVK